MHHAGLAVTGWRWAAAMVPLAVAQAAVADPAFVLDLPGGGRLPGAFVERSAGDGPVETLAWRSPLFETPFEFQVDELVGVRSSDTTAAGDDPRGFSCRLTGGDVIDGELEAIDERHVVIVPPGGEAVRIERGIVTSIARRKAGGMAGYVGPGGLAGWTQSPVSSWQDEAGRITSAAANASVERDVGGPARARYDIVLAWRDKPELTLAVAAGDGKAADPYRFEMLSSGAAGPVAMLVRQGERAAMIEPLELPAATRGRLQLTLFVDQAAGRLAVAVGGVDGVVDISVPPTAAAPPATRFRLRLMAGDVSLERLRVSEWQSAEPVMGDPDMTRVSLRSGEALEGEVASLDVAGTLLVKTAAGERSIELADVDEIAFAAREQADAAADAASVRLVRRGGGVLTGDLVAVATGALTVARAGIDRPVPVPLADLQSLVGLARSEPRTLPGRPGTMRLGDAEIPGCLVDAAALGGGLAWQPLGSVGGSRLAAARVVAATVDYVPRAEPEDEARGGQVEVGGIGGGVNLDDDGFFIVTMLAEEGAAARDGRIEPGDRILAIQPTKESAFVETKGLELPTVMNLLRGRVGTQVSLRVARAGGEPRRIDLARGLIYVADRRVLDEALAAHARIAVGQAIAAGEAAGFPAQVVLRSGDVVPAEVERVDAGGVRVRSPVTASGGTETVVVPHRLLRVVELDPAAASRGIEKAQWERLLTLPRSQQAEPPTHLMRLTSGDYLRGRLESLDADGVRFTVLGQSKLLPRAAVVRIIWLHADEIEGLDEAAPAEADGATAADRPAPPADGLLVQGISASGGRTTLLAERMEGPLIVGTSLAFGAGRIDTRGIDRLLIGQAVGAGDQELPFAKWKLRLAPLPRALRE